ncbi:MAG: hypothetical protein CSB55_00985 [Candidatus Cloacimonadota bacterium]|nr:MAG: hypothetical protein CSB55_00985 [Candidatus Cloacimonadota bacterium]
MNWYVKCFKNYANFNGRARRKEYWMFTLFNSIFGIIIFIIDNAVGSGFMEGSSMGILSLIYALAVLIPGLAVTIRRLHDIDKSGLMWFIGLIPLIGGIWLFILTVIPGTQGPNRFGPAPKEIEE